MDELYEMIFVDEDGTEVAYEFIDTLRYNKKDYDLFKKKGSEELEILQVGKETDDAVEYEEIDQELYDLLLAKFKEEM